MNIKNILLGNILHLNILFFCLFISTLSYANGTGFNFQLQKIIYLESNKNGVSISLTNNNPITYLMDSLIANNDELTNLPDLDIKSNPAPFIILPPLVNIEAGSTYSWTIRRTANEVNNIKLPDDRESQFWVVIRGIPSEKQNEKTGTQLTITPTFIYKLIYRPTNIENLTNKDVIDDVYVKREGDVLKLKNNSPLFMTFQKLQVGNEIIKIKDRNITLKPFSEEVVKIPNNAMGDIHWIFNDEYLLDLQEKSIPAKN